MRIETDAAGSLEVPEGALYGVHALRARGNFPFDKRFNKEWYKAMGAVKLAVYRTYKNFKSELIKKYGSENFSFPVIDDDVLEAMMQSASEIYAQGQYFDNFIVPAINGGAGTSINMNVNEIIANSALLRLGKKPGDYESIDPFEAANVFQSTNDTVASALKIAAITQLQQLEESINTLRRQIEKLEGMHRESLRMGSTEYKHAVPSSYAKLFSGYNDALSRDWWRVSKCFERIKSVNLGGTAIGTGLGAPRYYVMQVTNELKNLCSLPITKSENMHDTTANQDVFVELHAVLKAHAVNLEKISSDIRLLSSDLSGTQIHTKALQSGSSIMPGKVNPVAAEFIISCAHKVYANDVLISSLSAQGSLDLNPYIPTIGDAILDSLQILQAADKCAADGLFDSLKIDKEKAYRCMINSPSISSVLIPFVGYKKATELAKKMQEEGVDIIKANDEIKAVSHAVLKKALRPEKLLQAGFSIADIIEGGEDA